MMKFRIGLKASIVKGGLIPAFAFAATKGIGQNTFLDFATKYFPAPNEREPIEAIMKEGGKKVKVACDVKGEVALLIFKSLSEQHVGETFDFQSLLWFFNSRHGSSKYS